MCQPKFAQAGADVGTRNGECFRDFFGMQRLRREEQESVHLGHSTVDSPPRAHLTPMENKFLDYRGQFLFLYFFHFSPY